MLEFVIVFVFVSTYAKHVAVGEANVAMPKACDCAKHVPVRSTSLCEARNCAKHVTVRSTSLCEARNCAKHVATAKPCNYAKGM